MIDFPAPLSKLRVLFRDQAVLLFNAGALAFGTFSTAALGFVYWWFAARAFPAEAVGRAAAAVSLMNLFAHLGEVGLGPFLMGEIGRQQKAGAFLTGAMIVAFCASVLVSIMYLSFSLYTSAPLGAITGTFASDMVFAAACGLTGMTLVLDQAFVGLLRSGFQLLRNVVFAAQKLFFLIVVGYPVGQDASEFDIYVTWIAGQALSVLIVAAFVWHAGHTVLYRPDINALRPMMGRALGHHALSIAVQAPGLVLPFVVTVTLSPEVNAAFYAAWTLLTVALLVPASLSAVLFSIAMREPLQYVTRLRLSLSVSLLTGIGTALVFLLFSRFLLWIFNPDYAGIVGDQLQYLGFGALAMALKFHYLAVQRIRHRLNVAIAILIGGALGEIAAAAMGARTEGIVGIANWWVLAVSAESLLFLPAVYEAARHGLKTPIRPFPTSLGGKAQASPEQT